MNPESHQRPYVDYYRRHGISPVHQDISDLAKHFQRREALYRHLGLPSGLVRGRTVLEFGPGGGYNALFTASLNPARYLLVDGNPVAIAEARGLLASHYGDRFEFVESLIEDFETDERFDIVLCEGVLTLQLDPEELLRRVARFVRPKGLLVITCIDDVACLSDILRRLLGVLACLPEDDVPTRLAKCLPVFREHLLSLPGMSRPHEDWVHDNILQPFLGKTFPISEAIRALDGDFDVYGSSPRFLTDWRWYKHLHGEDRRYNALAREQYFRLLHNHLDYRFEFGPIPAEDNRALLASCGRIFQWTLEYENTRDPGRLEMLAAEIAAVAGRAAAFSPATAESLGDFLNVIAHYRKYGKLADAGRFTGYFGRGQQYLSFIRASSATQTDPPGEGRR